MRQREGRLSRVSSVTVELLHKRQAGTHHMYEAVRWCHVLMCSSCSYLVHAWGAVAFDLYDLDGGGSLSLDEIQHMVKELMREHTAWHFGLLRAVG